jgi:hypothetical protein
MQPIDTEQHCTELATMEDVATTQEQPQAKAPKELTATQRKKAEDCIREGLGVTCLRPAEIHKDLNKRLGFEVSKIVFNVKESTTTTTAFY